MEPISLTDEERAVCEAVQAGREAAFEGGPVIRAEVIRSIVLDLPLPMEPGGLFARSRSSKIPTPAGIALAGATVAGRLDLRHAGSGDAGACALEFRDCRFEGGFDGRYARFGRIAFENCRFQDPPPREGETVEPGAGEDPDEAPPASIPASIDLDGAEIQGELRAWKVCPDRPGDHMFISGQGARIAGSVELSRSKLKAPPRRGYCGVDRSEAAALNLNLARIDGDMVCTRGFEARGEVRMRNARFGGDVWILGACIGFTEEQIERDGPLEAMFMQSGEVVGHLTLSGWADNRDGSGRYRPFEATGDVNLLGVKVGGELKVHDFRLTAGSLQMAGAKIGQGVLIGSDRLPETRISRHIQGEWLVCGGDLRIAVEVGGVVQLGKCRIGGNLNLSELRMARNGLFAGPHLDLVDGSIGKSLELLVNSDREAELLAFREKPLASLPGFSLVETLWAFAERATPGPNRVQVGFLLREHETFRLEGQGRVFHEIVAEYGHDVGSPETAAEYLRVFCAYVQHEDNGPFAVITGKESLPPGLRINREAILQNLEEMETGGGDPEALRQAEALRRALDYRTVEDLPDEMFELRPMPLQEGESGYKFEACILYSEALWRSRFLVRPQGRKVLLVDMISDEFTGIHVEGGPVIKYAFAYPPASAGRAADGPAEKPDEPGLLTRPVLPGMTGRSPKTADLSERLQPHVQANVELRGWINLENLRCEGLRDYGGWSWGDEARISTNHFVYNRTSWDLPAFGKGAGLKALLKGVAIARLPPLLLAWWNLMRSGRQGGPRQARRSPWHVRRDWLYRQYQTAGHMTPSPSRLPIPSGHYNPQPFEQIIQVSRAEGREDYATRFEIEKKNLEWRLASRRARSIFLVLALASSLLWMAMAARAAGVDLSTLAFPLALVALVYLVSRLILALILIFSPDETNPARSLPLNIRKAITANAQRYIRLTQVNKQLETAPDNPALLEERKSLLEGLKTFNRDVSTRKVFRRIYKSNLKRALGTSPRSLTVASVVLATWLIAGPEGEAAGILWGAGGVFLTICYLPDLCNLMMRWGFGYLRRPLRATTTLALVFLLGWLGVSIANEARMLVVDVAPVAPLVREDGGRVVLGGQLVTVEPGGGVADNVHCGDSISEPLYALDILIPLIDLRQEIRCEVGQARLPHPKGQGQIAEPATWERVPAFWSVMKALYAILGWVVVSLVILTFAHAFRTRTEAG